MRISQRQIFFSILILSIKVFFFLSGCNDTRDKRNTVIHTKDSLYQDSIKQKQMYDSLLFAHREETRVCSTLAIRYIKETLDMKEFSYNSDSVKCTHFYNAKIRFAIIRYPKHEGDSFAGGYATIEVFIIDTDTNFIRIDSFEEPGAYKVGFCIADVNKDNCYDILLSGNSMNGGAMWTEILLYNDSLTTFQKMKATFDYAVFFPKEGAVRGMEYSHDQSAFYTCILQKYMAVRSDRTLITPESHRISHLSSPLRKKRPAMYRYCQRGCNLNFIPDTWHRFDLRDSSEIESTRLIVEKRK